MKTYLLKAISKIRYLALLMFLTLVSTHVWGADVTLDFTKQGYTNSKNMNDVSLTVSGVTAKFAKGSSGTNPTYYTSGTHVRCYYKNTITITSSSTMTKIVFTFASGEGSNTITPSSGTLTSGTWTGSATSVTFTIGGTSGHRRIQKLVVTTGGSYSVVWTINPAAGGTLSATSGTSTTVTPNAAYTYGSPAYTVTTGSATVSKSTNTFTATPTANCTIRINMVEKPKYTVTLKDNDATLTQSTVGGSVTLPSRTGCTGYTFAGWTKSWATAQTTWTTTAPTIIAAGSYTPTANENLYPVYTKTESGGGGSDVTFNFGYSTDWGQSGSWSGTAKDEVSKTKNGVTITYSRNGSNLYANSTSIRFYKSNTLTFEASNNITSIVFTCTTYQTDISSNVGTCTATSSELSWSGNAKVVSFTRPSTAASYAQITKAVITISGGSTTSYISVPNCCTALGAINGSISLTNESNC